jgi:hypothetical protein
LPKRQQENVFKGKKRKIGADLEDVRYSQALLDKPAKVKTVKDNKK